MSHRILRDEIIAYYPDGPNGPMVATAQRWSPASPGGKEALILTGNTRIVGRHALTTARAAAEMAAARTKLGAHIVDEDVARAKLAELGIAPDHCQAAGTCGARLPIGAPWCTRCGRSAARVAAGVASGATRRPAIDLRTAR